MKIALKRKTIFLLIACLLFNILPGYCDESSVSKLKIIEDSDASLLGLKKKLADDIRKRNQINIGIVATGEEEVDDLKEGIKKELYSLSGKRLNLEFKDYILSGQVGFDNAKSSLRSALDDFDLDLIVVDGYLPTKAALSSDVDLNKPVISTQVFRSSALGIKNITKPFKKKNLSYSIYPEGVSRDLEMFYEMYKFNKLHILSDLENVDEFKEIGKRLNFQVDSIMLSDDLATVKQAIESSDAKAIYLVRPSEVSDVGWIDIIKIINEERIPTFSILGEEDVIIGALAGLNHKKYDKLIRRISFNIYQTLILNIKPEDLVSYIPLEEQFLVNAKTANQIKYSPEFRVDLYATFVNPDYINRGEDINLEKAIKLAVDRNIDLSISETDLKTSEHKKDKSFSKLLPQINGNSTYTKTNKDRSSSFVPENSFEFGVNLQQDIFNDRKISDYRSSKRKYRSKSFERDGKELDIMRLAGNKYLEYLSQRKLLRLALNNLNLTKSNLELARIRYKFGEAGEEEIYRLEAQESEQEALINQQEAEVEKALVSLNQVLSVDPETKWNPTDIDLVNSKVLASKLDEFFSEKESLSAFRRYSLDTAVKNSPVIKSLNKLIEGKNITLGQLQRRLILPEVSAGARGRVLAGRDVTRPTTGVDLGRKELQFAVSADYPLFEGGGRLNDIAVAKTEVEKLNKEKQKQIQLTEKDVLSSFYSLKASRPNVEISKKASISAHKNLELIRKKYVQGKVNIVTLIDAQKQVFNQDKKTYTAEYDYASKLLDFQRSISWFEASKTDDEINSWFENLEPFSSSTTIEDGLWEMRRIQ